MVLSLSQLLCGLAALSLVTVQATSAPDSPACRRDWHPWSSPHHHQSPFRGPSCLELDDPNDVSDCSTGCYCNARSLDPKLGVCNTQTDCGDPCKEDKDCPAGSACAAGYFAMCLGGTSCVAYGGCSGPFGTGV